MIIFIFFLLLFFLYLYLAHYISYTILKNKTLKKRKWDLNICCGKTDGGGVNADIKKHKDLPNFVLIKDIYDLPFKNKEFEWVLSSHTIEHVDNPKKFYQELKRVGNNVTIAMPPLWDISATIFAQPFHKWIFLTLKKEHNYLPKFIPVPFASTVQKIFGQRIAS